MMVYNRFVMQAVMDEGCGDVFIKQHNYLLITEIRVPHG